MTKARPRRPALHPMTTRGSPARTGPDRITCQSSGDDPLRRIGRRLEHERHDRRAVEDRPHELRAHDPGRVREGEVRRPRRRDESATGDRAGEEPDPVAFGPPGSADEATGKRVAVLGRERERASGRRREGLLRRPDRGP